ncbi:MAG: GGDEF domain-containing protein [Deltaproteobacteria bacterium]|nr:GGDEF domain-containing protein [Deltaproteobacteria bacterium]
MKRRKTDRSEHGSQFPPKRRSLSKTTHLLVAMGDKLMDEKRLEQALHHVVKTGVQLTRSIQGTLRLLDDTGTRLLTSARFGPSVHSRGAPAFKVGEGFIGWVVVHNSPAYINNARSDPRFVHRKGQRWTPTGLMAAPLVSADKCIGVLSVARNDDKRYSRLDLDILLLIGQLSVPHLEIARLRRLNESDPLTLLHNRRHIDTRLPAEIHRARRSGRPLSAAMLDIDHFKRVNDTFGHEAGDQVLCAVSDRMRMASRSSDILARVGGEEFLAVFPDTNSRQGVRVAERIRAGLCSSPVHTTAGPVEVTISAGVATLRKSDDEKSLIRRADQALYEAKRKGRNKVVVRARN